MYSLAKSLSFRAARAAGFTCYLMRFPIIFLSRLDRHRQLIFTRGYWAIIAFGVWTIGIIGLIEIQHQAATPDIAYRAVDVTACSITIDAAGRICEWNEKIVARG